MRSVYLPVRCAHCGKKRMSGHYMEQKSRREGVTFIIPLCGACWRRFWEVAKNKTQIFVWAGKTRHFGSRFLDKKTGLPFQCEDDRFPFQNLGEHEHS